MILKDFLFGVFYVVGGERSRLVRLLVRELGLRFTVEELIF